MLLTIPTSFLVTTFFHDGTRCTVGGLGMSANLIQPKEVRVPTTPNRP
jgi:hypothetical protein